MSSSHQPEQGHHPTFMQYVLVAAILFIITIVEFFAIFPNPDLIGAAKIPVLAILSAIKFAIVIMFYMHLKYDHRMFTMFFLAGLALAFIVGIALLSMLTALDGSPRAFASANAIPYVEGDHKVEHAEPAAVPIPTVPPLVTTPTESVAPDVADTTAPKSVEEPAGGSGAAVSIEIGTEGDALKFSEAALSAASGSSVTVTFNNGSAVNQHNWVLVQNGTKDAVATDGTGAGPGADWIKPGDDRVVASSKLLNPGESEAVTFTAPAAGTYQFVCTFPGHNFTMFGDFTVN
jgi:azurin